MDEPRFKTERCWKCGEYEGSTELERTEWVGLDGKPSRFRSKTMKFNCVDEAACDRRVADAVQKARVLGGPDAPVRGGRQT